MVLDGLRSVLHGFDGFEVVLIADSGAAFIEAMQQHGHVDLALIDLQMKDVDGFAVLHWLKEHRPGTRAVVFSLFDEPEQVQRAKAAGASGYIVKNSAGREIRAVLNELLETGEQRTALPAATSDGEHAKHDIPHREFAYLLLICKFKDHTYDCIADMMGVTRHSVENYFRYFAKRFGVHSRAALVALAAERGWWKPPPRLA